jgi:hypothetical protein
MSGYDPNEPRDSAGRWSKTPGGVRVAEASEPLFRVDLVSQEDVPDDWIRLPDGDRIDELEDFIEWIANASREDEGELRAEIRRYYYDVGDTLGGNALNKAVTDVLEPGVTREERQAILGRIEQYAKVDPAVAAATVQTLAGLAFIPVAPRPAAPRPPSTSHPMDAAARAQARYPNADPRKASPVWEKPWAPRGEEMDDILGRSLSRTFPGIDNMVRRMAISNKSIDLRAQSYQNPARLRSLINKYADKVAKFDSGKLAEQRIFPEGVRERMLHLGVPKGHVSPAQQKVLDAARAYADKKGVILHVTQI